MPGGTRNNVAARRECAGVRWRRRGAESDPSDGCHGEVLGVADTKSADRDVVRGDAALADDPRRECGQGDLHDLDDSGGDVSAER